MATLGSSNFRQAAGTPVVAMGSPLGISGSMGYGMIASSGITLSKVDANYKIFATDITGSASGIGVLFNLQGQIVGIITTDRYSPDSKNMISAIGISELRKLIETCQTTRMPFTWASAELMLLQKPMRKWQYPLVPMCGKQPWSPLPCWQVSRRGMLLWKLTERQ